MSEANPPRVPMRRGLRILLVASLALNVAVVGLAIGAVVNWKQGGPPRQIDIAGGQLVRALSPGDRRALGEAMRGDPSLRLPSRRDMQGMMAGVVEILRAEPFDRAALESALSDMRGRVTEARDAGAALLVDRIAEMTPEERADFADAVELRRREERRGN